jgi:N-acetylglucosaminyl-diphospho-decaprenol L-rhamnosyltransferase
VAVPSLESITAVITNWGTPDDTIRAARALAGDGLPLERIVVVDNGSADESYQRFQSELAGCVLVGLDENVGYARGANAGARRLPGTAYAFVNSDAFLQRPGTLHALLAPLDNESVAVVAPRLLNVDLSLQPNVVPVNRPGAALARASGLSRLIPNRWQPHWSTHWDHSSSREIECADGAVLLVRGGAWDQLGGFNEGSEMYAEDLDLCWRARKRGWKVWFAHEAQFVHVGAGTTRRTWSNPHRAERIGRAEAVMIRRNLDRVRAELTLAFICAGLAARWLLFTALRRQEAAAALRGYLRGYVGRTSDA